MPAPSTYVNGTALLTSALRGDVTNGVTFLASRPGFAGHNNNTPAIGSGNAFIGIALQVDDADPWLGHSPLGAQPQRWYCQAPGWYLAEGTVPWNSSGISGVTTFGCGIGVNTSGGVTNYAGQTQVITTGSPANPVVYAADLVQLTRTGAPGAANADYIQVAAWNDTPGFALQGAGANFPRLQLRWMGTGSASSLAVPANAAFPVPPADVDQTWLNANVRDTLSFLINPPMTRCTGPAAATLASGTWPTGTLLKLNTKTLDNFSAYSSGTGLFTVPAGCGGAYYAYAQVSVINNTGNGSVAAGVSVNGTTTWGDAGLQQSGSPSPSIAGLCTRLRLSAGDTVGLEGFQNTGAGLAVGADTKLVLAWEAS